MDVGLVCDQCSAFQPMGARACERCGAALSLDTAPASAPSHVNTNHTTKGPSLSPNRPRPTAPVSVTSGGGAGISATGLTKPCSVCGTAVPAQNHFCGGCGAQMPEETRPSAMVPPMTSSGAMPSIGDGKKTLFFGAMQAARAKLVLIKGDGLDGVSFTLAGQEHIAGRGDADIAFGEDPFMSPRHANFFYRSGKLVVRDEGSENGVFVRIRGSVPVQYGDRFLVGEQVLEICDTLHRLEVEPTDDGTYLYASPRASSDFRLVQILRGGETGLAYRAQSEVVSVGRDQNDLNFPDDPFISGHHARVSFADGKLTLTDLGSKNGTFLRLSSESPLEHGDYVFMGQQLLRVEIV